MCGLLAKLNKTHLTPGYQNLSHEADFLSQSSFLSGSDTPREQQHWHLSIHGDIQHNMNKAHLIIARQIAFSHRIHECVTYTLKRKQLTVA